MVKCLKEHSNGSMSLKGQAFKWAQKGTILILTKIYFLRYNIDFQGVCKGEGESGVSSRFHGFEGAAEAGEGADWIR